MKKEPSKELEQVALALKEPQKPLTPIQRFQGYMETYKENVLPALLKKHNIEPAQFVQIVLSEIKKNEKS